MSSKEQKHLLIQKAFIYEKPRQKPELNDYVFLDKSGYWIDKKDSQPYVLDTKRPKPRTKKADVETGEDQKGE
ncbi:hypothetical protein [Peribacillus sp. AS_2]|uniref:hypothetical protein n=1 Tax=Peribacillus sp. AS_2 TaxID=2996755 RepID=UPI0022A7EBBD|nr:hypothetical protein [Peribacillus sp. AS_2]MCZ0871257.1 hypothetical protein [Peribacillus sp. AS_2]